MNNDELIKLLNDLLNKIDKDNIVYKKTKEEIQKYKKNK